MIDETLYDAVRKNICIFHPFWHNFTQRRINARFLPSECIILICVSYWMKQLCNNLLTCESGMCRPHPIATQSSVYIWNISVMYAGGSVTYWTYVFLERGLLSCKSGHGWQCKATHGLQGLLSLLSTQNYIHGINSHPEQSNIVSHVRESKLCVRQCLVYQFHLHGTPEW